jgi:hypothetical protein
MVILLVILLAVAAVAGYGFEIESLDFNAGLFWLGASSPEAAPSPLHWRVGAALPMSFTNLFLLAPELNVSWDNRFTLNEEQTRAIPAELERADQVNFINIILDAHAMFRFDITESISAGPMAFPSFLFRIPIKSWGQAKEDKEYKQTLVSYLWGKGRFFFLGAGGFFSWAFSEGVGFVFQLKTRLPVFHIWDQEQLPFHDQMMVAGSIGLKFYFD